MSGRLVGAAAILTLVVAFGACRRDKESSTGAQLGADTPLPPIDLQPLPAAPDIQVEPVAVPGGDGRLAVVAARPQGAAYGNFRPTITFSKPIVPLGDVSTEDSRPEWREPAKIEPPLAGDWKWLGSTSAEFVVKGLIPYSTEYTLTVNPKLAAIDGTPLNEEPFAWVFRTPAPMRQSTEPEAGYRWLKPVAKLSMVFNQPVLDFKGHLVLAKGTIKTVKEIEVADEVRASETHRRYARAAHESDGFKNRQTRYELETAPLPLATEVSFEVSPDLRGKDGPLMIGQIAAWTGATYGPMEIVDARACNGGYHCPYGPMVIEVTNEVPADVVVKALKERLNVTPAVEIDWEHVSANPPRKSYSDEWHNPTVVVPGKWRAGTKYSIAIAPKLPDVFGQTSASAYSGTIETNDLPPGYSVGNNVALLEAKGDGAIPVEATNLTKLETKVWPMSVQELARYMGRSGSRDDGPGVSTAAVSGNFSVAAKQKNVVRTLPFPVKQKLAGKSNFFYVEFLAPEIPQNESWRAKRNVAGQITDLAVHAKLGATSGLVWVTRLSDGKSVADAAIKFYDEQGGDIWTGKTDASGLVAAPGLSTLRPGKDSSASYQTPYVMVAATKDGDTGVTLSTWSAGFAPYVFDLSADWDGNVPKSLGLVTPERGIYRPGEEVFLKGMVRYRELGKILSPAKGSEIYVSVTSSRGKEVWTSSKKITEFGTWSGSFKLDADVPLGTYNVRASANVGAGGQTVAFYEEFRVEEFRPPQFKVDVSAVSKDVIAADPLQGMVLARYLFGGAMSDAETKWSVNRNTISFVPPGNAGFEFGVQTWWWDDDAPSSSSDVFATGEGRTDPMGQLVMSPGTAEAPGGRTYEYVLEAEVADVNRQRMANRVNVVVHPAQFYAGVKMRSTGFAEAGKPVPMEIVAVAPTGERETGAKVDVVVKRREWKWIRKKGIGDRWYYESQTEERESGRCSVKSAKTPEECSVTPKDPGFYIVEATATDSKGRTQTTRTSFYAIGNGWVSWQRNESDKLDLVADRTTPYDIGETAKILVKSPYPEAEAVLTVEREGVLTSKRVKLTGSATALEIPITENMLPNAFIGVVLVRGRVGDADGAETGDDPGRPSVRAGYTEVKVEKKTKRLSVTLTPDSAAKRPRDKVKVAVQVADWKGAGQRAEVAVWAVDEGVLRLTDYQLPDPIEALHPARGLSVRIGESLMHLVARRKYGEKGGSTGGSGGEDSTGSGFRSKFKTTVLFAPETVTDASGKATVEFELPDNLTTYRLMAIAITKDDRAGKGQSEVVVSKPLLALPALPRLARVGDTFEAGVVVHSPGGKIANVEVKAETTGLTLEGPATTTVSMSEGKAKEVRFHFKAETPGEATLRFTVTGGGETDKLEQKIPIQLPVGREAVAVYGDTTDLKTEGFVPPGGVRADTGGLEVTLSSTILGGFSENMNQLVDYPYGCLEQMSSRLVPFVALREIQSVFGMKWNGPDKATMTVGQQREGWMQAWIDPNVLSVYGTRDPDEVVRGTVNSIESLQNPDGGFRYWSSSDCSADFGSAYAMLALNRAKEVGYEVDDEVLEQGRTFLEQKAAGRCTSCTWSCQAPSDTTRAFALYTLARGRTPKASYYAELYGRRDELPLFGKALLADAMFIGGGDRAQAKQLLQEILNQAKESPREVHFEETDEKTYAQMWSSDPRTTAIVLQTLTDISPDHPYVSKIGNYLTKVRQGNGRFRNTQEAAFALMALTEVVRTKEKATPDFTGKVALGGKTMVELPFKGRSMSVKTESVAMAKIGALEPGKQLPFEFTKSGPGVLYYGALLRYSPAEMPMTPLDRGLVVQRWFEPYAGGGQVKTVRAGELVRVRVRVSTHMERQYVAVDVPLPAGLEPVDTTLASTAKNKTQKDEEGSEEGYDYESDEDLYADGEGYGDEGDFERFAGWFWSPFNHTEMRDDRVVAFADHLPPGVHVVSFVARATTPGKFMMKPAQAEEMYTPEVFGRSEGGIFEIVDAAEVAGR